ncbi:MAG: PEP-utilizing protein mobile subunit [Kineosporiaceae bacterium]|nr:PEP-utilizing protein mobile subunit [Kineosporiaceae bacterium]
MPTVIPIDDFVTDEWYPGFRPAHGHSPFVVEPLRTFEARDVDRFWFLDYHWSRGLTPMGMIWNEDGYSWGSQFAAETLPLPPGRGIAQRMAGTHTYASPIEVSSSFEMRERTARLARRLPAFLRDFRMIWADREAEIDRGWNRLRGLDVTGLSLPELAVMLREARRFHKRAFEIHFEIMYPLLVNYLGFHGACTEMGLDPSRTGVFLQGVDTRISQTDRELWRLTHRARETGLASVFAATDPADLAATLDTAGGPAAAWMTDFREVMAEFGWRSEGTSDIALPSWIEDPTPPLGTIKTFLLQAHEHDFDAAQATLLAERDAAIEDARTRLTSAQRVVFDAGLASVQAANFTWWQEEHNAAIDLRAALPMRWAALAIADRIGADRADDTLFLFWPELLDVAEGRRDYDRGLRGLVEDRREYFDHWRVRRIAMPKTLGTVPDRVHDPILIEIFGLNRTFLSAVGGSAPSAAPAPGAPGEPGEASRGVRLVGLAASGGLARGIARVLTDADTLHLVEPGEVLVCESTSPNWTPAFGKLAACVCDGGGILSHAAIVGREYGVPTVTAVGLATALIKDGDMVEVDGSAGVVTVLGRG